jgi:hypothetical protein
MRLSSAEEMGGVRKCCHVWGWNESLNELEWKLEPITFSPATSRETSSQPFGRKSSDDTPALTPSGKRDIFTWKEKPFTSDERKSFSAENDAMRRDFYTAM